MNWREKLGEANKLFEGAKAIMGNSEATAEQKEGVPQMLEDARKLMQEALQYKNLLEDAQKVIGLQQTLETFSDTKERDAVQEPEFKSWEEFLACCWQASKGQKRDPRLHWFKDVPEAGHEEKALSGAAGSTGGFLVPTQFLPQLQAVQGEDVIMRRAGATVIRMASRQVTLPVLDQTDTAEGYPHWFGGMRFYWQGEGTEKQDSEPSFRQVNLVAKKLIGLTHASDEILADSAVSLADFLSGPMGMAGGVAWMEDYSFIRGVGGGQPQGIVPSPATLVVARQAMGAIDFKDIINMYSQFLPSGRGIWIVSQSAMPSIIQLQGPDGNPSYVWQPNAREGIPGSLFGMPVYWSEKAPGLGQKGDIILADPRYYLIGDRQATTIESTPYARWIYDQTTWRVVHRVDGQPWLSRPLTYADGSTSVSPFVVLGSTQGT